MKNRIGVVIIAIAALLLSLVYILRYEVVFYVSRKFIDSNSITGDKNTDMFIVEKLEQILKSDSVSLKHTLTKHLLENNTKNSETAEYLLAQFTKNPDSVYMGIYRDDSPLDNRIRIINLMRYNDVNTSVFLIKKLTSENAEPELKATILLKLTDTKDKSLLTDCLKFLDDPDPRVRRMAVILFASVNKGEYTSTLLKKMYDENGEVAFTAAMRLTDFNRSVTAENYKECLTAKDPLIAMIAIYISMVRNDKSDIPVLKKLRDSSPNEDIRKMAEYALKNMATKH